MPGDVVGIAQLVCELRTFPHPLLTVRRSFEQRFLGVCRAGSASVSGSEAEAQRPTPIAYKSIASVFIPIRDTFTNRYDGRTHRRAHMRHGLLLGKRGFRNRGLARSAFHVVYSRVLLYVPTIKTQNANGIPIVIPIYIK